MIEFNAFIEQVLEGYRSSYDIEKREEAREDKQVAFLHMHMEHRQKFIMKDFTMSAADADEYVYMYHYSKLDERTCEEELNNVFKDGLGRVNLDKVTFRHQHMCTRAVAVFICDDVDEAAYKKVKKCRLRKSFQFSLKGWIEVHAVIVDLKNETVVANPLGRETANYLKKHVKHYAERANRQ